MNIAVVADSTSVIGTETIEAFPNLYVIPLHVHIGQTSYKDGIDIQPAEFFSLMEQSEYLPNTSQPSVGELIELFNEILDHYDQIIYITISSGISGTYQTGLLAQHEVDENRIHVFDTLCTSVIQKHMALTALHMIAQDKSIQTIMEHLENMRNRFQIYLVVDDLKHLARTGRVSNVSAKVGSVLKIKPILKFEDGKINLTEKVRTIKKAHKELLRLIEEADLDDHSIIRIAHADGLEYASQLKEEINQIYPNHVIEIDELSPVISVHTGPNTLGLGWFK